MVKFSPQASKSATPTTSYADVWTERRTAFISQQLELHVGSRALPVRQNPANPHRADSFPLVSGDTYRSVCHWLFDETGHNDWDPTMVQQGDLIFAKTDMLDEFFQTRHPLITKPYILISSNSDHPSPGPHLPVLKDATLFAWFGQNGDASHPKFHPLPIGFPNQEWEHGNFTTLRNQAAKSPPLSDRRWLLYINIGTGSNVNRLSTVDHFKSWNREIVHFAERGSHEQYLQDIKHSLFVLSPPGNGIDCHRTWEAILMGAIPVILPSFSFGHLAQSAPVMIVENFKKLQSAELLAYRYPSFNVSGVFANHWFSQFEQASDEARQFATRMALPTSSQALNKYSGR